ncbi:MAG: CDF family Co(II)/Ni(II) efflux transporter DmeF [Burkholderiales bacterium]|jgi:cation diffusion facilitator family transporter
MHIHTLKQWQHSHDFADESAGPESSTLKVLVLTAVMMVVEIGAGIAFGSMALLADGWHMATHVAAFGITLFAYRYARKHASDPRYSFGTGKVSVLGGFASAVALAVVALVMALESVMRMFEPHAIQFNEAIFIAAIGLAVNLLSGLLLSAHHHHDHHEHEPGHHQDHNLRAAYFHVLADAMTSLFAIVALVAGKYFGWTWLDPVMGVVGAAVIARWAYGLMRDSGHILLDGVADARVEAEIRKAVESNADNRVVDLHVWQIGPRHYSVSLSLVTHHPEQPQHYKSLLAHIPRIAHVIVETNRCEGAPCLQ